MNKVLVFVFVFVGNEVSSNPNGNTIRKTHHFENTVKNKLDITK